MKQPSLSAVVICESSIGWLNYISQNPLSRMFPINSGVGNGGWTWSCHSIAARIWCLSPSSAPWCQAVPGSVSAPAPLPMILLPAFPRQVCVYLHGGYQGDRQQAVTQVSAQAGAFQPVLDAPTGRLYSHLPFWTSCPGTSSFSIRSETTAFQKLLTQVPQLHQVKSPLPDP